MDPLDLAIQEAVQRDFPLESRPFDALARRLNIPAGEIGRRIGELRARGVIRRIGPMFDRRKLGLHGCLVAAKATPEAVDALARLLERRPEVTHNYLRSGPLNLWFTVTLREGESLEPILTEVRATPGVSEVIALPTRKVFKLDASFPLGDNSHG